MFWVKSLNILTLMKGFRPNPISLVLSLFWLSVLPVNLFYFVENWPHSSYSHAPLIYVSGNFNIRCNKFCYITVVLGDEKFPRFFSGMLGKQPMHRKIPDC